MLINFIVALTVVAGGIIGYFISLNLENIIPFLLPFAAGGFIYIATSDLMPEIKKETNLRKSIISFLMFMLGIALMFVMK